MKRNWMRHAAVATALVAALALAAPAQASGWTLRIPGTDAIQAAWQWIARLWPAPVETGQPAAYVPVWEKEGGYVDPNGGQPPAMPPPGQTPLTSGGPNS